MADIDREIRDVVTEQRKDPFSNPRQPIIDSLKNFLRTMCDSKLYVVEVFGNEADLGKFRKLISKNFKEPAATPANMQSGMVHVRVKRPAHQHAGDVYVCQFKSTELLK